MTHREHEVLDPRTSRVVMGNFVSGIVVVTSNHDDLT
jgi:hypothetical protein